MENKHLQTNSVYLLSEMSEEEIQRLSLVARLFIKSDFSKLFPHLKSSKKIADIGCGTGEISHAIAKQYPNSQVFGFDADPLSLKKSKQLTNKANNLNFYPWILGSHQEPIEHPFDMVLIRLVLLHIPDPIKALKTLSKYLTKNGTIYIIDLDDRDTFFMPIEPWQQQMLDIFQQVQTKREGTRQIGQVLGNILEKIGAKSIHTEKIFYSMQDIGHSDLKKMFLPIVKFYLDLAKKDGIDTANIYNQLSDFCSNPEAEMKLCYWHASATVNNI